MSNLDNEYNKVKEKATEVKEKVINKAAEIKEEITNVSENSKIPVMWFYIGIGVSAAVVLHILGIL